MISAYVRRQRLINGLVSGLMLVTGIGMMAYAAITIVSDVKIETPQVESFTKVLETRCQNALNQTGFSHNSTDRGIDVHGYSLDNPLKQLSGASLAIQQCLGYTLASFCMGSDCQAGPVSFTLKPQETK